MEIPQDPYPWSIQRVGLEFIWSPPFGSLDLSLALQYSFPDLEKHNERIQQALVVTFGEARGLAQPVPLSYTDWIPTPTFSTPTPAPEDALEAIPIVRSCSTVSAPAGLSEHTPISQRKGRVLKLTKEQRDEARRNRGHACKEHREKKQKCHPRSCSRNGLNRLGHEKIPALREPQVNTFDADGPLSAPLNAAYAPSRPSHGWFDISTTQHRVNQTTPLAASTQSFVSGPVQPDASVCPGYFQQGAYAPHPRVVPDLHLYIPVSPLGNPHQYRAPTSALVTSFPGTPLAALNTRPPVMSSAFAVVPHGHAHSSSTLSMESSPATLPDEFFMAPPLPTSMASLSNEHPTRNETCLSIMEENNWNRFLGTNRERDSPSADQSDVFRQFTNIDSLDDNLTEVMRGLDLDCEEPNKRSGRRKGSSLAKRWLRMSFRAPRLLKASTFS